MLNIVVNKHFEGHFNVQQSVNIVEIANTYIHTENSGILVLQKRFLVCLR